MFGGIFALVLYVLVFSFGVEKGKRYTLAELKAEKTKQEALQKDPVTLQPLVLAQPDVNPVTGSMPRPAPAPSDISSSLPTQKGQYTIQLIAFKSRELAAKEVERLKKEGHEGFIAAQGKFFFVCTDAFEKVSEAKEKLLQLREKGFAPADAYIRPIKGLNVI